ncbi:hypothetical protein IJ384_02120 [bacterium]|nr:hypothetical protein [bacterium]
MDLIKKLTGKNPSEYEMVAKSLIDNSDVELFAKLVKQDDFLFDFIKTNVAKRIQNACNRENYLHLLDFFEHYSPFYDTMIARVLHSFSGDELLPEMKEYYLNGSDSAKAYAVKYFSFVSNERLQELLPLLRQTALSNYEPLALNSIEVLSILKDEESKKEAFLRLDSKDEFEQYNAVKFLVAYQAKDSLDKILDIMKKSSLAENIASEILYLINIEELLEKDFDSAILVLCNIINAIPEILPPSIVCEYNFYNVFENLPLTSTSAVLFRLAKDKFEELTSNDEYLFDSDKNTTDEIKELNKFLKNFNNHKLESLYYEELYEESDFVFFAIDYVDEITELEALLDSNNETLLLKILTILKEKNSLNSNHKEAVLPKITSIDIKSVIQVL